ncbi:xanthine dehydrogenase family protein subunit M [Tabrizicola piscis]|uniref:Xanthine dehydrogenase family protein subunit M n=1 Tax=Tabrizicola piscis TaxID=2494374 RepID=A0A3S8UB52_9RHOB|nr:xanthine dehydrogenase family protein subunit M [Tabrizicola piscis]AZL60853.1 xanthine dehydrogenase family protein subunit M [Tabrizicola piscis]
MTPPVATPDARPAYARPDTLAEALGLLSGGGWRVLAGGTDLYPGAGAQLSGPVLDLAGLADLAGIRATGQGLRIGAATTWADLASASLPGAFCALQQAARQVGGRQVQVAGTIGGNLCNASPAADGVPPLLVLGAGVELASHSGVRHLPLAEFLLGPRQTALQTGEVLTAILIPPQGMQGQSAFVKLGARRHLVISIAMVAVRVVVEAGRLAEVAVAVGSCSATATRLPGVEAALSGVLVSKALSRVTDADVSAALSPIDDVRATAVYRNHAAAELVRRALAEALAGVVE